MALCVATPMGNSCIVDQIYRLCFITIQEYDTLVELIMLDIVDFNMILGMDRYPPIM